MAASSTNGYNNGGNKSRKRNPSEAVRFRVFVSFRFITLSLLACILLAFAVGRTARVLLLGKVIAANRQQQRQQQGGGQNEQQRLSISSSSDESKSLSAKNKLSAGLLPNPIVQLGKTMPETLYTSKNFNTAGSTSIISRFLTWGDNNNDPSQLCEADQNTEKRKKKAMTDSTLDEEEEESDDLDDTIPEEEFDFDEDEDDEIHLPSGQHLLLDIKNVDSSFLASEERLANAMLEIVYECGLTLLSYHCHGLQPSGVSCVGVLLESHVSFHTWPSQGVITLDLFTCGPNSLLPIFNNFRKLFSVPSTSLDQSHPQNWPRSIWSYKLRGFSSDDWDTKSARTDFFTFPIGSMTDYKEEIATVNTKSFRMDIYDVLRPHFQSIDLYLDELDSNMHRRSQQKQQQHIYGPDRIIFKNGILQSRRSGDASYHETLVHPAMFAHSNPRRVLIVGGGSNAVLREVLKHKTVNEVIMIERQPMLSDLTQQYLPDYSDCSQLVLGEPHEDVTSCFDDPRLHLVVNIDPSEYLLQNNNTGSEDLFDVVIIDEDSYIDYAVEEEIIKKEDGDVKDDRDLIKLLFDVLSPTGIVATHFGDAPMIYDDVSSDDSIRKQLFIQKLIDVGFTNIKDYIEGNSGFDWPWEGIIAFKTVENSRNGWFQNEASISLAMRKRSHAQREEVDKRPTTTSAFNYYDGAMHQSHLKPSKASETLYCRRTSSTGCDSKDKEQRSRTKMVGVDLNSRAMLQSIGKHKILSKVPNVQAMKKYLGKHQDDDSSIGAGKSVYNPAIERNSVTTA